MYLDLNCWTELEFLMWSGIEFQIFVPEQTKVSRKSSELGLGKYNWNSDVDLNVLL